jgi:hypothetical protein
VPEPIQSAGNNICQIDESYELGVEQLQRGAVPQPSVSTPPASSPPAVQELVKSHDSSASSKACLAEEILLVTAGSRALMSLAKLAAGAATEVGLPFTIAGFVADSVGVGVAAAKFANCRDDAASKPAAR